jgi:hypothetical protein
MKWLLIGAAIGVAVGAMGTVLAKASPSHTAGHPMHGQSRNAAGESERAYRAAAARMHEAVVRDQTREIAEMKAWQGK